MASYIVEGVLELESEDGGQALVGTVGGDGDEGLFVRVQSWSESRDDGQAHDAIRSLEGKRIRVTVETLED